MERKTCVTGAALAATLGPLALVAGQVLTSPQAAFAVEPSASSTANVTTPSTAAPSTESTANPSPVQTPDETASSEATSPGSPQPSSTPEPSSSEPALPEPEPTSDPVPSADPEPAPSESEIQVPDVPGDRPGPDVTGGAAGLPEIPAESPSAPPAVDPSPQATADSSVPRGTSPSSPATGGEDQTANSGTQVPAQEVPVPSTLASSVAGAQASSRLDSGDSQLELFPVDGTVLGIFSSQQTPGYAGGPEWMEGFLNVSGAQSEASSSADPNQAAGVAGAETQGHQSGAVAGSSVFQRGGTIMNGARPLIIFTGLATAGLALVVFNFVWRNRAPRN